MPAARGARARGPGSIVIGPNGATSILAQPPRDVKLYPPVCSARYARSSRCRSRPPIRTAKSLARQLRFSPQRSAWSRRADTLFKEEMRTASTSRRTSGWLRHATALATSPACFVSRCCWPTSGPAADPPARTRTDPRRGGDRRLSELGLAFLMFIVGLEIDIKKLMRLGPDWSAGRPFQVVLCAADRAWTFGAAARLQADCRRSIWPSRRPSPAR